MKKLIIVMTICFLLAITILNDDIYASTPQVDFLNIKIGSSVDFYKQFTLISESGFNFYEMINKDRSIYYIKDSTITASLNFEGNIDIFGMDNELLYTIPGNGSVIIGSESIQQLVVNVNKNNYRDYITFISVGNKLSLINHVQIEHYLYGVVPKEMPATWPIESLKAQAVVARSFALSNINKHKNEGFNLCDSTCCQVYKAYDNENANTNIAVNDTSGIYVYYNGNVASTPYHSSSGGYTEDSEIAWGGSLPYLIAIKDIYSEGVSANNWTIKMTPIEIANKLSLSGINIGQIQDIQISKTSSANRVLELKIVGSLGNQTITGNKIRTILGNTILKSTLFRIEKSGDSSSKKTYVIDGSSLNPIAVNINSAYILDGKGNNSANRSSVSRALNNERMSTIGDSVSIGPMIFTFNGLGNGHGVGMSQYGAMEMAKLGYNYEDIIKHYYTGVDIININGDN